MALDHLVDVVHAKKVHFVEDSLGSIDVPPRRSKCIEVGHFVGRCRCEFHDIMAADGATADVSGALESSAPEYASCSHAWSGGV